MGKTYIYPDDLTDISFLSSEDARYKFLNHVDKAARLQASITLNSPGSDIIRLSIVLIKKGEKDCFYYIGFLLDLNGNLKKFEEHIIKD